MAHMESMAHAAGEQSYYAVFDVENATGTTIRPTQEERSMAYDAAYNAAVAVLATKKTMTFEEVLEIGRAAAREFFSSL